MTSRRYLGESLELPATRTPTNPLSGAAVGRIVFTAADAEAWQARGERIVLVRTETSPEDVGGM